MEIINGLRDKSKKNQYNFQPDAKIYRRMVDKWEAEFSIPEFLFERERYARKVYVYLRSVFIYV